MGLTPETARPTVPVTLDAQQVAELLKQFASARHDINNALSLISAASELIRMNPDMTQRMLGTLNEQPQKIVASLQSFTSQLESSLGRRRP